ncbi:hypothetical protein B7P43_G07958 [Cryptotermes secundus]|uniref:Large ribosomal subunit protein mL53 n=1 Tax=Cryptotermes secundus TaxID=105785 RepID=A0A2J7Q8T6_9NEOP|nr:hypothetical protein B7P43_G07958 [Cryptotermes secundus]
MSIRFSGTLKRSAGVASAIAKQTRLLNLKPVKNIVVKFDPFNKNVKETSFQVHPSDLSVIKLNKNNKLYIYIALALYKMPHHHESVLKEFGSDIQMQEFLFSLTGSKVLTTNISCKIKTNILCDRSQPSITFTLSNNEVIVFKSANLTNLELLQLYNKHITPLASTEEPETIVPQTKSEKKARKKR